MLLFGCDVVGVCVIFLFVCFVVMYSLCLFVWFNVFVVCVIVVVLV